MRHALRHAAPFLALMMISGGMVRAADDPFVGKWFLDREHSHYESGDIPERMTIAMEATENGVHYRSETTYENGKRASSEYTAGYDGHLQMVVGDLGPMAPVSLKRIDANTVEASYTRAFQVVATARRVVSPDGSTMTITTESNDKIGKTITNVSVFRKVG
jgi:hypothetical protein